MKGGCNFYRNLLFNLTRLCVLIVPVFMGLLRAGLTNNYLW